VIKNPGFEDVKDNLPTEWNFSLGNNAKATLDNDAFYKGKASLLLSHQDMNQSSVYSSTVNLELGKLYKLSAWLKTEDAFTEGHVQYPTSVPACIRMESMPFTMHSQAVGATKDWQYIEILFFASKAKDRISLHFGYNGLAKGKVWFDDVSISLVENFSDYIPKEKIEWYKPAFRFEEKGWIFIHIEGDPYNRGFQYGYLTANDIKTFINKLAINVNRAEPTLGWRNLRSQADMIFLRKYEPEYLTEMKGIADGAAEKGITIFDRTIDLLDIVTINSYVDIVYGTDAITKTPHAVTGKRFNTSEEQLDLQDRLHKCSSFLANKSATTDGRIVFSQLFMWNAYTGTHWNVIIDIIPDKGNRLVYQTFPGGIHSGSDFYINSKGIMLGETTVSQTPFNIDGTPQSNRIRLAAQYANSIDDAVKYLLTKNNGTYTNDWLMADTKTDEIAIFCLGTYSSKLWRSSKNEFYGNQKDWYWSNNNPKALEIRKELVVSSNNAPHDLTFRPWDRDMAFWKFYEEFKGKIDVKAGIDLINSSPINRPHAHDGKITNSEMAEKLMFFAHYGKVTLREQFVGENGRVPDNQYAIPRLTLGYTIFSPITTTDMVKKVAPAEKNKTTEPKNDFSNIIDNYKYPKKYLWQNSVFPASDKENWFISATADYWNTLNNLPTNESSAVKSLSNILSEHNSRLLYTELKEGKLIANEAKTVYDVSKHYYIPKIKGVFLLHQLRLLLGNKDFSKMMNDIHDKYISKNITNDNIIETMEKSTGKNLKPFISQWIGRDDMPDIKAECKISNNNKSWNVNLTISQENRPYNLLTSVLIKTNETACYKKIEIKESKQNYSFEVDSEPIEVIINPLIDFPTTDKNCFTFSNFYDDFNNTVIVYGTTREIEANHTLALRFQKATADRFTEILLPVKKDCEIIDHTLKNSDLILLGGSFDNSLTKQLALQAGLKLGNSFFEWNNKIYTDANDGLMLVLPNPYNSSKMVTFIISNSGLQLYQMCKNLPRIPSYAIYKDDQITETGYHKFGKSIEITK
jgi:hypothetical protein